MVRWYCDVCEFSWSRTPERSCAMMPGDTEERSPPAAVGFGQVGGQTRQSHMSLRCADSSAAPLFSLCVLLLTIRSSTFPAPGKSVAGVFTVFLTVRRSWPLWSEFAWFPPTFQRRANEMDWKLSISITVSGWSACQDVHLSSTLRMLGSAPAPHRFFEKWVWIIGMNEWTGDSCVLT